MHEPTHKELYSCAVELAREIGMESLNESEARSLYDYLVFSDRATGGKAIVDSLTNKLVTECEVRQFLVNHTFTATLKKNGWPEVSKSASLKGRIHEMFEIAVFGRLAIPTKYDLNPPSNEELTKLSN